MKKRWLCLFLSVSVLLSLTACSGGDVTVSFDAEKPWKMQHEICTYEIKRYYTGGGTDLEVASGQYVTEISVAGDETTGRNTFTLTYNDEDRADTSDLSGKTVLNKNMTDTYVSEVRFKSGSMVPVGVATKTFNIAQRQLGDNALGAREDFDPAQDGVSFRYKMTSPDRYGDPRGYSYSVDYDTNASQITFFEGSTVQQDGDYYRNYKENTKRFTLGSGTRFDNEQLPYLVRALSSVSAKGSATFYLTNPVDSYMYGSYIRHTMSLSCADKLSSFSLPAASASGYIVRNKEGELPKNDAGDYAVPCVQASVGISSEKSGPAINMLITDPSVAFARASDYNADPNTTRTTCKVILQMTYTEYSLSSAKTAYKTVYTLKSYTASW